MTTVLVPFGNDILVLTVEQFESAREAGRAFARNPDPKPALQAGVPNLLSAEELALRFSIPRSTIYELRKAGKLEALKLGRHLRFDPEKALALLQARPRESVSPSNGVNRV